MSVKAENIFAQFQIQCAIHIYTCICNMQVNIIHATDSGIIPLLALPRIAINKTSEVLKQSFRFLMWLNTFFKLSQNKHFLTLPHTYLALNPRENKNEMKANFVQQFFAPLNF